jgi:hypothetical protein
MQLDWHDLRTNGCPALFRALKQIEHALAEQSQLLSVAEKQDQLILAAQLQQGADITDLQYLISEEIMARIAPPEDLMVVVEDLDHGWLTVRQPNDTQGGITMAGTPDDEANGPANDRVRFFSGWCPDSETSYAWHFIDSDGFESCTCKPTHFTPPSPYPADDGEISGADELTDVGMTYRELDRRLAEQAPEPGGTPGVTWIANDWVVQLAAAVDGV